jgi:hypothetical protein
VLNKNISEKKLDKKSPNIVNTYCPSEELGKVAIRHIS